MLTKRQLFLFDGIGANFSPAITQLANGVQSKLLTARQTPGTASILSDRPAATGFLR
jgi:hypothetical protein